MIHDSVFLEGSMTKITSVQTVIVGGGLAGFKAAIALYDRGMTDVAVLTDSREGATSRYAKSDGQSYFKLSESGNDSDSPYRMARAITSGGTSDGDIALVEASMSSRCFYQLAELGVPFQQDKFGGFPGLDPKTENGRRQSPCGTDLAARVTAILESEVKRRSIPIYENHQVIKIFTDPDKTKVVGVLALNRNGIKERHQRFLLFNANYVVLATGGPGGLFFNEGYPKGHNGLLGFALEAGAKGMSLGDFEYGICAVRRSLMMNGAYQNALPKFVSTDEYGRDAQEFLIPYFDSPSAYLRLQEKKASEWAFDIKKTRSDGSSLLDLLVYQEMTLRSRHVFMDFRDNPTGLNEDTKPFERLRALSEDAYMALLDQNLDPSVHPIEISVSMTHHHGGLKVDTNYETSLKNMFAVGEVAGGHGKVVPQGASINQTQVSALRSSEVICRRPKTPHLPVDVFVEYCKEGLHERNMMAEAFLSWLDADKSPNIASSVSIKALRVQIGKRMDRVAGIYRDMSRLSHEMTRAQEVVRQLPLLYKPTSQRDLPLFFQGLDLLYVQIAVLSSMIDEAHRGGKSLGTHFMYDSRGMLPNKYLPEMYRFALSDGSMIHDIQEAEFDTSMLDCIFDWRKARPIDRIYT